MAESKEKREGRDYFATVKFIRDLVHDYVYLTKFELELIDTVEFQRLKDIRQLTCQHVYPAARHTRFEHSLGVLELTRQAVKNLNRNGFITDRETAQDDVIFDENLQFNAALAALLHDVGHCPFSHLGEVEFDKDEVWRRLYDDVREKLRKTPLLADFRKLNKKKDSKKPGAQHEQMSCVMILEKFHDKLSQVKLKWSEGNRTVAVSADFELLIRCILGCPYDVSAELFSRDKKQYEEHQKKNVIVGLINSRVFDMDKLDYIMRDSHMTGIGTPSIDTHRLFKNMYLSETYSLVFTSRAVPALQNMIDARDELYMYVYNHHAVVFSDFMNTYIFRRLEHNARDFRELLSLAGKEAPDPEEKLPALAMAAKNYLFSPAAIVEKNRSDSDMAALLNTIYHSVEPDDEKLGRTLEEQIAAASAQWTKKERGALEKKLRSGTEQETLLGNIRRAHTLIARYLKRDYLKPWWKTYSEFNKFIERNFLDDSVRKQLCSWICHDEWKKPAGDEFRSQIAKHVNFITHEIEKDEKLRVASGLLKPLGDGEFFVIERSARFFDPETVRELDIAQKTNAILGMPGGVKYYTNEYYVKELTNIIPQRDYYSIYAKNSFYIFSKPLGPDDPGSPMEKKRHYQLIEQIFVFVATSLVKRGTADFQTKFSKNLKKDKRRDNEEASEGEIFQDFKRQCLGVSSGGEGKQNNETDT